MESGRGKSKLFKLHGNPFGMKYRPGMSQIASPIEYEASDETDTYCKFATLSDAVKGYWTFIDRPIYFGWRYNSATPEDFIRFITFKGYFGGPFDNTQADRERKEEYINKVLRLIPEAEELLKKAQPSPTPVKRIWKKKGVMLEVGHGLNPEGWEPGAVGVNGVREHDLNWIAAKAAQRVLDKAGVPCVITDFGGVNDSGLREIGKTAAGYDVFCSIHHNSAKTKPKQGAEVFLHRDKGDDEDLYLSQIMSAEIAEELGI
ncbi:MAG: N-acetylmuramoyl-L-alanine amidase, partial [Cyanobacteria bacterium J06649_11]